MSSSYRTPMSAGTERVRYSERQEFVSEDEDTQSQKLQSNRERVKFFSDTKSMLEKMFYRKESLNLNLLSGYVNSSYESSYESMRNWKTARGKRALLCGVTYNKQKYKVKRANYDVIMMRDLLISRFRFPPSSINILAEMDTHPHPTKRNIQEALKWLVKDNQCGDSLVFYFSGHGLQIPDFFDDEIDGLDETICPLDFRTAGLITDNEINDIIVRPLKTGVILHAIVDASHRGTILDPPYYVYSTKENHWLDNHPPSGYYKGTSGGHAISIGACEDYQLAIDASSGKQMEGAVTYAFRKAFLNNSSVTYAGLLASMHKDISASESKVFCLRGPFQREKIQEPLLSSSKVFDVNKPFVL